MKKISILIFLSITLFSCEDNIINDDDNPCLRNKRVNVSLNLNLPLYADLQFSGTDDFIRDEVNFIEGIYISNIGNNFTVLELAEPNDCTKICDTPTRLEDGFFVYDCGDVERSYDIAGRLVNGTSEDFNMRVYTTRYNEANQVLTISY